MKKGESQIVAGTPRDVMSASKKLSSLLENRDLRAGANFGSVIKCPKNISFLRSFQPQWNLNQKVSVGVS